MICKYLDVFTIVRVLLMRNHAETVILYYKFGEKRSCEA